MHLYFLKKERKIRCFLVIFCFLLSLSHPVYRWPKINCIRKEPQVLHLCSMQPSNSRWPHKKTQCATRHLCLFLFSTRHKNRPLQRRRSAALTRVVMKILERLIPSHLPSLRELLSWWWTKATTPWTWQPWLPHQQRVGGFWRSHPLLHSKLPVTPWRCEFTQVPCELCVLPIRRWLQLYYSLQGSLTASHFVDQLLSWFFISSAKGSVYGV